ncbi:MAG: cupin domain-containing protein [Actinomycetes bacterium]
MHDGGTVPPAHETVDVGATVGRKLRTARHRQGLTIDAVAKQTGLTKGFISRLERDEVSASVASLVAVCRAVGLRMGELFDPPHEPVVRRDEGAPLELGGHGLTEVVLSSSDQKRVAVVHATLDKGGTSGDDFYTFDSDTEFAYVLSGQLRIDVGDESFSLDAGDSLTFRASSPHRWHNTFDGQTVVLWVLSPAP